MAQGNCRDNTRVLFVTASTKGGGAERMLFNIIRQMDCKHCSKLFITSDEKVSCGLENHFPVVNANKTHAINAFPKLFKELKNYRPDHVFTTSSNVGYMLILAKKLLHADFKVYIRCAVTPSEIYQTDFKTRMLNKIISITYNSADLIIAQTDFMREDLIKSYSIKPDRVRTIRNIVDKHFVESESNKFKPIEYSSDNYNIVAAGALYSVKGFDILIEAIAPLIKHTNRHLYILGEERYESGYHNRLNAQIKSLGLSDNIHLLGHKSNPYPYLKAADLFVMSSRKEGYPNVVLESLCLGTPVVATDVVDWSGVIFPGQNGLSTQKNNVDSLRQSLIRAFDTQWDMNITSLANYNYNELFG